MASFQVTSSELKTKANELRSLNGTFKQQVGVLESKEAALATKWEGTAQQAFRKAFQHDKPQMDKFYDLIEKYCKTLEDIAQNYEQTERQNTEIANNRSY